MKRRDALKIFGGILGGGLLLTSSSWIADNLNASQPNKLPQLPWTYKSIDPKKAAERAYFGFYKGRCCYGAFDAIIGTLQDEVGFPFTGIPTELFVFGRSGIAETGSTCGTLIGVAGAIFLLTGGIDKEKQDRAYKIIQDVFRFYEQEALPKYIPEKPKLNMQMKATVANSPICHISVSKWCAVTKFKAASKERDERCARITADCVLYALKLLEAEYKGSFKGAYPIKAKTKTCMDCHDKKDALNNTKGNMECGTCHFDGKINKTTKHPPF
ncbi:MULTISPECIES: C-GCAxxG-C-C family (seleno)protein [Thermodesulfovibrio]|uniref:Cytochrome C chain A n=1 Tax=Thermodesulfovibrio yellowstonii TaxID=28262 RepID=A0A9W6GG13_9BACT|nr:MULTISPECIES: C-GCAxxG-C-C family (seleno)protein [Thermodesulfovibrio]GLI53263.1 cytochrome C chain A [Thermodesulfovibrio islandicus]